MHPKPVKTRHSLSKLVSTKTLKPLAKTLFPEDSTSCMRCIQLSKSHPSMTIQTVDPRFSDKYCIDCCCVSDPAYHTSLLNRSAFLQNLLTKRLALRSSPPSEWNDFIGIWFPENPHGTKWVTFFSETGFQHISVKNIFTTPIAFYPFEFDSDADGSEVITDFFFSTNLKISFIKTQNGIWHPHATLSRNNSSYTHPSCL